MRLRWMALAALALCTAGTTTAQERGHVAGVFGWTFGQETDTLYGAQFGIGVSNNLQIVGGVERLQDVLTGRYALFLQNIASLPGVDVTGKVPATYYGGGVRFTFPGLAASPFLEGQVGATQVDPTGLMVLADGDDVTDEIFDFQTTTEFTFLLGAGLRFDIADNFLAEARFRFFDILTEDEDLGLNRLDFAFGVRF